MLICHLSKLMKRDNWSQGHLSRETGIREQTLANMQNNKIKQIPVGILESLCDVFECNISDLFEYKEDEK